MSNTMMLQPSDAAAVLPTVVADMGRIAGDLSAGTGARGCFLVLAAQQHTPVASFVLHGVMPEWHILHEALTRQQRIEAPQLLLLTAGEPPVLALPLSYESDPLGWALLVFDVAPEPSDLRIAAAGRMAALALQAFNQIADLQVQAQEIAERTRLREIQMSRNLIRGVIDGVPMGLVLLDATGTILAANRALSDRFSLEPAAMVGHPYAEILGDWDGSPASRTFNSRTAEKIRRTMQRPNGMATLLEIASIPLLDTIGQPHQVVEVWEDITERVALQTQLVRAEKLAAIGHLAASIAHEVGNPLQAIQGFLSLFLEQSAEHLTNRHFLELAEEEIERIVHVLSRLRDLYRPRAEVVALIDFNELIRSVLLLTSKQLERGRIRVLQELDPTLAKSMGVADQIKQVILNLVLNAADAMSEGGMLQVQSYMQHSESGAAQIVLALTDTGVGISPNQLAYLFDGLHTTKERGMGLGLYTSRTIVEHHQGRIEAQSKIGEGTTFTIVLPVVREGGME